MSDQAAISNVNTNVASRGTLVKLLIFSLSLGLAPLTAYFGSKRYLWNGNDTFAAITAIVAANAILVAYIVVSLLEDKKSQKSTAHAEAKKDQ